MEECWGDVGRSPTFMGVVPPRRSGEMWAGAGRCGEITHLYGSCASKQEYKQQRACSNQGVPPAVCATDEAGEGLRAGAARR